MELPSSTGITKEKKRRFFWNTGGSSSTSSGSSSRSSYGQNSWESIQSPTTSQNLISSINGSFDGNSACSVISAQASNRSSPRGSTSAGGISSQQSLSQQLNQKQKFSTIATNAPNSSASLDEVEHLLQQHRRFMAAPRRARSAERFDGMRVNIKDKINHQGAGFPTREELLERNQSSPRTNIRTGSSIANSGTDLQQFHQRSRPTKNVLNSVCGTMSPPPTYQAAINEKAGPPSYRQAIVNAAQIQYQQQIQKNANLVNGRSKIVHPRQFALANRGGTMSLDNEFWNSGTTMRTAKSVPSFTNESICTCSKCQVTNKRLLSSDGSNFGDDETSSSSYNDYNDSAVYMESQAFLMHEIMTDGMAFCSIM